MGLDRPLHVHHEDDEAWYVLEGALRFRLGEETFEVGAGGGVLAPKGPRTHMAMHGVARWRGTCSS